MTERNKDLVQIIRDNPGCRFTVDNDCWWCQPPLPKPEAEMTGEDWEAYDELEYLACDSDVIPRGDGGYVGGCSYGGDILAALAEILGVKIESV